MYKLQLLEMRYYFYK